MLLALDTATNAVTVAIHDGTTVIAESTVEDRLRHGELLAPAIARVLDEAGVGPSGLTRIAVGVGPGPYTGLRIGLAMATTMGAALGIEVVGVCTLDIVAAAVSVEGTFVVATDARRQEVYWARYADPLVRSTPPAVDFPATVATHDPVAGNGPLLYPNDFPYAIDPRLPSAADLARLVVSGSARLMPTRPLYLRRPDAVVCAQARDVTCRDIRPAVPGDLDQVVALESALFGANAWSRAAMAAEFAEAGATRRVFVAVKGRLICGYAVLLTVGDTADLQRVGVTAALQRSGVGSRLLGALLESARRADCTQILLEVGADNAPALALYRRHGFAEIDRRPRYYPDGGAALVMRLDLDPSLQRPASHGR